MVLHWIVCRHVMHIWLTELQDCSTTYTDKKQYISMLSRFQTFSEMHTEKL